MFFCFCFLFLPSRNCGPRVSVQLQTTQFSMGSFSICLLKGCYYTLTYKLELPANTPSVFLAPPSRSLKPGRLYLLNTHLRVIRTWRAYVCVRGRVCIISSSIHFISSMGTIWCVVYFDANCMLIITAASQKKFICSVLLNKLTL